MRRGAPAGGGGERPKGPKREGEEPKGADKNSKREKTQRGKKTKEKKKKKKRKKKRKKKKKKKKKKRKKKREYIMVSAAVFADPARQNGHQQSQLQKHRTTAAGEGTVEGEGEKVDELEFWGDVENPTVCNARLEHEW